MAGTGKSLRTRIASVFGLGGEKAATGIGYNLPVSGGFIPASWPWNWWQQGRDPLHAGPNSIVHACVDAYAQTIAALPARHVVTTPGAGKTPITTSAMSRVLRRPNSYQTKTDFMLNQVKGLLLTGNSYAIAMRNDRTEVAELHLVNPVTTQPLVDRESGAVFYALGNNEMLPEEAITTLIPQRDVLHLRLYTPDHPLIGVSPIINLATNIASTNAINAHQAAFFNNMARPSGILTTDERLTKEQQMQLLETWHMQSQQLNSGGVPILSSGLKWQSLSITSQDSQVIDAFRMGVEEIARAFRVPLPLIGDTRNANYNNVEMLVAIWMAQGLGFMIELLEQAYSTFFGVPHDTQCEFDVDSLMRTDFAGRIDALTKGILGGLYSPNEARRREGLADADFGDEPRVQAQVVPLSQVGQIPTTTPTPDSSPSASGASPAEDDDTEEAALSDAFIKFMVATEGAKHLEGSA